MKALASTVIALPGLGTRRIALYSLAGYLGNVTDSSIGGYVVISTDTSDQDTQHYRGAAYRLALRAYQEQVNLALDPEVA